MTLYAVDDVDDAIDATRAFLTPVDLGAWLKLAFVVFFLGGTGTVNPVQFGGSAPPTGTPDGGSGEVTMAEFRQVVAEAIGSVSPAEWAILGVTVGAIVLLGLVFGFVGAVMEFVFVESLSRERVSIREYWGERWRQGGRLFGFRLVVGLLTLALTAGPIVATLWPLATGGGFSLALFLLAIAAAVVVGSVSAVFTGFTTQFVVPVMVAEDRTVLGAWRRFWPTLTGQWKQYVVYAVLRLVLSVAVSVVVAVVVGIGAVLVAIPFAIVGVGGGVLVHLTGSAAGWAVVAVAVLFYVLTLVVLSVLVAVPVQTYLRYYALLVLGDTESAFDLVAERRRAIRG